MSDIPPDQFRYYSRRDWEMKRQAELRRWHWTTKALVIAGLIVALKLFWSLGAGLHWWTFD